MRRRDEPQERHGVRVGMPVQDLDGKALGRVTALHDDGFHVLGGFPILFRRDLVARYDEVRSLRDGTLVLARSERDLFDLARGLIPPAWRVPAPPEYPTAATPAEARLVFEDLASGALVPDPGRGAARGELAHAAEPLAAPPEARREERLREDLAVPPPSH